MYNLLIIDDEKQARETLSRMVPWESLGIGAVETARNGMDALDRLSSYRPDLVLCDVRMPKMDGMTFASHLHRILPNCRLLFISGYADKEVMKSAIRLQASNFIEKPIDMLELSSAVRDIVATLRVEEATRQQQRIQRASLVENMPAILERAALGLTHSEGDQERERKRLERIGCRFLDQGPFLPLAIQVAWDGLMTPDEQIAVKADILTTLNTPIALRTEKPQRERTRFSHLAGFCSDELLVVIVSLADKAGQSHTTIASGLLLAVETVRPGRITAMVGLGEVIPSAAGLAGGFHQALDAVHQLFYCEDDQRIASYENTARQPFTPNPQLYVRFQASVKAENLEEVTRLLMELKTNAISGRDGNINRVRNAYFDLIATTLEATPKSRREPVWNPDQPYLWSRFGRMVRIDDLSDFVLSFVKTRLRQDEQDDGTIGAIIGYLKNNHHRSDLSLRDVAEAVHLSQSYLCSLFKKFTGSTIVEYTTGLRIAHAKTLLEQQDLKLFVIAEQSGFDDANYFSTIFKKATGITPSEYRERLNG